jgi:lactoylglutathione lyase
MAHLKDVYPVSDEDLEALPVRDLAAAIEFYETVLGFSPVSRGCSSAVVSRDEVRIGLIWKPDHEPGKAGSLAFHVDDFEEMHRELQAAGGNPGAFGIDEWNGRQHRTFFMREDKNGYCYCFYCPA